MKAKWLSCEYFFIEKSQTPHHNQFFFFYWLAQFVITKNSSNELRYVNYLDQYCNLFILHQAAFYKKICLWSNRLVKYILEFRLRNASQIPKILYQGRHTNSTSMPFFLFGWMVPLKSILCWLRVLNKLLKIRKVLIFLVFPSPSSKLLLFILC